MAKTKKAKKIKKETSTDKTPRLEEMISSELDLLLKKNNRFGDALDDNTSKQLMKQIENKLVRSISPDKSQVRDLFDKIKIKE